MDRELQINYTMIWLMSVHIMCRICHVYKRLQCIQFDKYLILFDILIDICTYVQCIFFATLPKIPQNTLYFHCLSNVCLLYTRRQRRLYLLIIYCIDIIYLLCGCCSSIVYLLFDLHLIYIVFEISH